MFAGGELPSTCYHFPEENGCLPGDHFKVDQEQQLIDYAHYHQFQLPIRQRIANWVPLMTLLGCGMLFCWFARLRLSLLRFALARVFS